MNEDERLFSRKNPWTVASIAGVVVILVLSVLIGFLWMPYTKGETTLSGLWDAICTAAGVPRPMPSLREMSSPPTTSSDVIVVPRMIPADTSSIGRGGTLALRCTMCHGARGMSGANTPNLAGQNPESIYKQLRDLQSQHRVSEIMAPHTRNLSDQDMRDLAAYYGSLARATPPANLVQQLRAPSIVQIGAPMRNVAPCMSCHGGSDVKTSTPYLDGEPADYLRAQLQAFANGTRKNDIGGQMRNVARQMTPQEIDEVVKYYSSR